MNARLEIAWLLQYVPSFAALPIAARPAARSPSGKKRSRETNLRILGFLDTT